MGQTRRIGVCGTIEMSTSVSDVQIAFICILIINEPNSTGKTVIAMHLHRSNEDKAIRLSCIIKNCHKNWLSLMRMF